MTRTLLATALLTLLVPATGRADDADAEKQVAMLSKKIIDAQVKGDTKTLDEFLSDDFVGINPNGDIASKSQDLKDLKDGTRISSRSTRRRSRSASSGTRRS